MDSGSATIHVVYVRVLLSTITHYPWGKNHTATVK